jgi:hypothetical protein
MTMTLTRTLRTTAATAAVAVLLAAGAAHSTATRYVEKPVILAQTAAEQAFPDAEFGVDPMVTGPVSASFREKQVKADCAAAVWPDVPLGCYPNR